MMQSSILFLFLSTAIALVSMRVNFSITKEKFRADQAFWMAWIFLIWSAEIVTSFSYFEFYNQYSIESETHALALLTFFASAVGFFIGSIFYRNARGVKNSLSYDTRIASFVKRWQAWFSISIFFIGLFEFTTNLGNVSNLLDLRISAVEGELTTGTFYTQFFLFSQAFIMLIGFCDGISAKVTRSVVALTIGGLVLHNLAVGGRINIIVAPVLYLIPFVLTASQRQDWSSNIKLQVRRFALILFFTIVILFAMAKLSRAYIIDTASVTSIDGFLLNVLFAIPMYISDTFISVSVHVDHARVSDMPWGYFTLNSFYRLFDSIFPLNLLDPKFVFGHAYYQTTPDPWGWTQTNLIPRLVSDFGDYFWIALVPISAVVQWLSLYRMRNIFLGVVIRSLMVFSSAYSILAAMWLSSQNVYIVFYSLLLYFLAVHGRSKRRYVFNK